MPSVPVRRLVVYASVITVLLGLWIVSGAENSPFGLRRSPGIYRAPPDSTSGDLLEPLDLDESGATKQKQRDQFAEDLRALSSDDAGDPGAQPTPAPTPSPTFTPTETLDDKDASEGDVDDGDARSIFSELEPKEGSKVTDPLGGVVIRGAVAPQVSPITTPVDQRLWAGGQARGYTMLYAMQPQARPVVEAHIQTMLASRIRELYIGVLIDGTFGRDFAYLKDIIARLSSEDQSLTVALYLTNGPTMRKGDLTPVEALFSRIDPVSFRQRIRRDQQLRAQFLAVTLQAKEIFSYNQSLSPGNSNIAIVMLEDNLDVFAYRSMREIAAEQLGSIAGFIRNPCLGCSEDKGSDDDTLGDPREEHQLERFGILQRGDAYSLDGVGFRYPASDGDGVPAERVTEVMRSSFEKGLRYVGLWRHDWQGVKEGVSNKATSERIYIPSNPDQQEFELQMLRTGLVVEAQSEE
jgi:hypothetical protein